MTPKTPKEKAQAIVAELTRGEGIEVLTLLLERSTVEEIFEALQLAKLDGELRKLTSMLFKLNE